MKVSEVHAHSNRGGPMPAEFKWIFIPLEVLGEQTAVEKLPIFVEGNAPFDEIMELVVKYPGWELGMFIPLLPECVFLPPVSSHCKEVRIPHGLEGK